MAQMNLSRFPNRHTNGTELAGQLEGEFAVLQLVVTILGNYAWIMPVVFGFPGNILAMLVASRKQNRTVSTSVYIVAMAAADTGLLVLVSWFYPLYFSEIGKKILQPRDLLFKLAVYMMFTFGMQSGFVLAAMSVDRLLAVRYPMAAPGLCTTTRAKKIVSVTFVIVAAVNVNIFYTYEYVKDPDTGVEFLIISAPGDNRDIDLIVSGFQFIFGTLCPFLIIFCCNVLIIATVREASIKRSELGNNQRKRGDKDSSHLTRMLIMVSAAYIVTSLPYRMYVFVMDLPGISYDMTDPYWSLRYSIEVWCMFDLWCWNFSINFYLYCLAAGRRYRRDTIEVIKGILNGCGLEPNACLRNTAKL